jgi:hypothetical protein
MIGLMATSPTVERPVILQPDRRARTLRRREREQFGGRIQWEAVFFGLLAGFGLAALLTAMLIGALVAAGVADFGQDAASLADHLTAGGGAILIALVAISYLTGGYVAARMARFDGWRQALGVWILSALMILAVAVAAWVGGGQLDPSKSITLPANPIDSGPLSHSGWVPAAAAVVVALISSLLGGVLGERFHRAVDRAALEEPEIDLPADGDGLPAEAEEDDVTEVEEEPAEDPEQAEGDDPDPAEDRTRALS